MAQVRILGPNQSQFGLPVIEGARGCFTLSHNYLSKEVNPEYRPFEACAEDRERFSEMRRQSVSDMTASRFGKPGKTGGKMEKQSLH